MTDHGHDGHDGHEGEGIIIELLDLRVRPWWWNLETWRFCVTVFIKRERPLMKPFIDNYWFDRE